MVYFHFSCVFLLKKLITGLFYGFFSNDDRKSNPKDVYQFDRYGERAGLWTWHFPNGEKETEGAYRVGKKHGIWTDWWKNGQVKATFSYRLGIIEGNCSVWYENGQKASEREFIGGQLKTARVWLPNGEVCPESHVQNGNGRFFIHGQKGIPARALTYRNGKKVQSHFINTIPVIK